MHVCVLYACVCVWTVSECLLMSSAVLEDRRLPGGLFASAPKGLPFMKNKNHPFNLSPPRSTMVPLGCSPTAGSVVINTETNTSNTHVLSRARDILCGCQDFTLVSRTAPGPVVLEWLSSNGLGDMKDFTLICHTVPHTQPQRHQSLPRDL